MIMNKPSLNQYCRVQHTTVAKRERVYQAKCLAALVKLQPCSFKEGAADMVYGLRDSVVAGKPGGMSNYLSYRTARSNADHALPPPPPPPPPPDFV